MAEKADTEDFVPVDEIIMSNMITIRALIDLLEQKGIIGREELLDEIRTLRTELMN